MTPQEIFNKSWAHIHEQGEPANDDIIGCVYWDSETGRSCAIGGLLTQEQREKYRDVFGGVSELQCEAVYSDLSLAKFIDENYKLLVEIQEAHDGSSSSSGAEFVAKFERRMKMVAEQHELEVPA